MTDLIAEFNAETLRLGTDLSLAVDDAELKFTIRKLSERLLITPAFDVVLKLCKRYAGSLTILDLSECRIVSSIELTFIGFVLTQTRFHGGKVRIICPSPINRRALAMVGFDGLAELVP
jgi:hypothetical protein